MGKVLASITMSLDGYVAGPDDRPGAGLGEGGERLHYWIFGGPWTYDEPTGTAVGVDAEHVEQTFMSAGAWIVGRTMYDVAEGWGDDPGFGLPVFVVTHRPTETVVKGDTTFEFVTEGFEAALDRARTAAGGKHVALMGGADVLRQALGAGVVDELRLTIAPTLLGGGKRLFDGIGQTAIGFEPIGSIESPFATHLRYRVASPRLRDTGTNAISRESHTVR